MAETDRGNILLLTAEELDACAGSIDRLVEAIDLAVARYGLAWPQPT